MNDPERIGSDWLAEECEGFTDKIIHVSPSDFNEERRYIPDSVTSMPGPMRYDITPWIREIVDCLDVDSPVREVNFMKGVQNAYTTGVIEAGIMYLMGHIKTLPGMLITADKELAATRVENNILPMIQQSGMDAIIRSSDEGNSRKTGSTAKHLQWEGGGYLIPGGAKNADKMRQQSICFMFKDEIDAWPWIVGKDGDPDELTDGRCKGYWLRRKIVRGSTPRVKGQSHIHKAYLRGDQREATVLCNHCSFPQKLWWTHREGIGGFFYEFEQGTLILESVHYRCINCGHKHFEHDKEILFSPEQGAHWNPTARPAEPNIRSYHLPATYSPIGMLPWSGCVADLLKGFDPETKKVIDIGKYQAFRNNILGEVFEIMGAKIGFVAVSAHRRAEYGLGQVPNTFANEHAGGKVLFLTCQVDVHKENLAVAVMGWVVDAKPFLVDYWRFEARSKGEIWEGGVWEHNDEKDYDCSESSSPAWGRLRDLIDEKEYIADEGTQYRLMITLIDAGYANDTVSTFCMEWETGVHAILGRDRPGKNQKIQEFSKFKTQAGGAGYKILVDHYKDRLAPVLRREWLKEEGPQKRYHFNAPVDTSDAQLKELTRETRREMTDTNGVVTYVWHRPGNARNELWDLLVYGHAAVEIIAWEICIEFFELETIDWVQFWEHMKVSAWGFTPPPLAEVDKE